MLLIHPFITAPKLLHVATHGLSTIVRLAVLNIEHLTPANPILTSALCIRRSPWNRRLVGLPERWAKASFVTGPRKMVVAT